MDMFCTESVPLLQFDDEGSQDGSKGAGDTVKYNRDMILQTDFAECLYKVSIYS